MANEVHGAIATTLIVAMERAGLPTEHAARLIKPAGKQLHPDHRVDWDQLVAFLEHLRRQHGQKGLDVVAAEFAVTMPALVWLASFLLPPRWYYRAAFEICRMTWFLPFRCRDGDEGALEFTIELPESHRASKPFFAMFPAVFAAMARNMGCGDARVEVHSRTTRSVKFSLTPPRERAAEVKLTDAQLAELVEHVIERVQHNGTSRRGKAAVPTVAKLEQAYSMTRAEARVARRLADGHSLKEIAGQLSISEETARTHAKRAMHKTDTHRQAELVALMLRLGAGHA